jgi:hypothetical protein
MAKAPIAAERIKPLDTLVDVTEKVLAFRYVDRQPNLVDIGRCVIAASRALHIKDLDERISCENAAVMSIAKRRQLVS